MASSTRQRESIEEKSERLRDEGRVSRMGNRYEVQGDHGTYVVEMRGGEWRCPCPARGDCAHAVAVSAEWEIEATKRWAGWTGIPQALAAEVMEAFTADQGRRLRRAVENIAAA
ncbi:MAG: hypothetical protein M3P49_07290 [Actinomycetota bacterium]|jgi:hypothetical protein|nr:hypothetical protein [Actinomycetota bacterium]